MIDGRAIERVQRDRLQPFLPRNTGGVHDRHDMVVRIKTAKRQFHANGDVGRVELTDDTGPGRIERQGTAGEGLAVGDRQEVEGVDNLETVAEWIEGQGIDHHVQGADSILDGTRNAFGGGSGFDQAKARFSEAGVAGNGEDDRTGGVAGGGQHAVGNRRIDVGKVVRLFVEVIAGGDAGIGGEVGKTGMNAGAEDNRLGLGKSARGG